jgi:hypothetical protein
MNKEENGICSVLDTLAQNARIGHANQASAQGSSP